MKEKVISLMMSVALVVTVGFKVVSYADSSSVGTVEVSALNVRSGPGNSYPVIWTVRKGDTLEVVGKEGSWLKINFNKSYAYVCSKYVSSIYSNTVTEGVVTNCSFLNVRSGPGKGYALVGCIAGGQSVQIVDYVDGWYKIIYDGSYVYVSASYITAGSGGGSNLGGNSNGGNGSENDNSSNDSNSNNTISTKTGYIANCSFLNVRAQADSTSRVIDVLAKGDKVQIVDEAGPWYKILYKNEYAFVSKSYVVLNGSQTGGSESGGSQTVLNLNNFLFVGDSFTKRISTTIQNNTKNSYVRAVSGYYPSDWIANFDQMPSDSNIKGISLLIGANGVTRESNVTDTKQLIDLLEKKYPGKMIFVQRVFPVGKGFYGYSDQQIVNYNKKIDSFNSKIKSYCQTKSNVKFIDTTSGFVASNGYLINCESDGLHIAWDFNNKFFNNIKQAIIEAY
ncbi:MAG: SH3 domain-containing protein [Intestinibacter sp.]|uniref:SH3 domain-containing protein n=1 Tax=Intestinibacter sp. TaxID=1965304 RepID=UPI003F17319D